MLPFLFVFFTYSEAGRDAQVLECINYYYIQFSDVCKDCGHLVATHKYSFSSDDEFQVWLCSLGWESLVDAFNCLIPNLQDYSMQCNLCGHGEATASILPDDPREKPFF